MTDFRKLIFEKVKYGTLKMSKSDYVALVTKGLEQGLEETQVKKQVSSCLKDLKNFKEKSLPLSILEERNIEFEADEFYIPADILKIWREESKTKLKELEKILASNNPEELQLFLSQNPEMELVSKVPLSKFIKNLHKTTNEDEKLVEGNAAADDAESSFMGEGSQTFSCPQCDNGVSNDTNFCSESGNPIIETPSVDEDKSTVTIFGYKESFLICPPVKIIFNGEQVGKVGQNEQIALSIENNSKLVFKCWFRSTECDVCGGDWVLLSFDRFTGALIAIKTNESDFQTDGTKWIQRKSKRWLIFGMIILIFAIIKNEL